MTSIITGADGFIGSSLTRFLTNNHEEVISLNRSDGDLNEISLIDIAKINRQINIVYHLAAKTFVPYAWDEPEDFVKQNTSSTLNVLNYCRKKNVPLIYISAYIYGSQNSLPINEEASISNSNPYALSKILCEEICKFYADVFSLDITILRPFNIYGPGQSENFIVPQIINQVKNNQECWVNSYAPKRDFVHIEDLLNAIFLASKKTHGLQIYNVGSGSSISVEGIINHVEEILGKTLNFKEKGIIRENELLDVIADISKIKSNLGWSPKIKFKDGIKDIMLNEGII